MVLIIPITPCFPSLFSSPLETVQSALTTVDIIVTLMFQSNYDTKFLLC